MATQVTSLHIIKTPNQKSTQPQLNLTWVRHKNDSAFTHHNHHPPNTPTQCQQYLSCYMTDFNQTLRVGFLGSSLENRPKEATFLK